VTIKAFAESDQVDGLLRLGKFNDALENPPMLIEKKVIAFQFLDGNVEGMIVEENGAQDAALRAGAIRERTFESRILSHIDSLYFRLERAPTQRFFAFRHARSAIEVQESECLFGLAWGILCGSESEVNLWWLWNSQEPVQKNERCGVCNKMKNGAGGSCRRREKNSVVR
jgi:hypothetical protein